MKRKSLKFKLREKVYNRVVIVNVLFLHLLWDTSKPTKKYRLKIKFNFFLTFLPIENSKLYYFSSSFFFSVGIIIKIMIFCMEKRSYICIITIWYDVYPELLIYTKDQCKMLICTSIYEVYNIYQVLFSLFLLDFSLSILF